MSEYLKLYRKAHDKIQQIEKSSGYQISNEIKGLKDSVYIFEENFRELEEILDQFKSVDFAVELLSERYSEKREMNVREFVRAFHNFIVSVKSLVDHTRNFTQRFIQKADLIKEYDKRVEKNFQKNDEVKFIEKLRNFFCHYRLPKFRTKITINFEKNTENSDINLLKEDLKKFDGWGNNAKKYISECPEEINIREIIYRYKKNIDRLYNWLFNELEELHTSELRQTERLIDEYEKINEELEKKSPFKSH